MSSENTGKTRGRSRGGAHAAPRQVRTRAKAPAATGVETREERAAEPRETRSLAFGGLKLLAALVFLAAALLLVGWTGLNVHPSDKTAAVESYSVDLSASFGQTVNNAASTALTGLTHIQKVYRIDESTVVAPEPNPDGYGSTADPAVIEELIAQYPALLDGQETVWNRDRELRPDTEIVYYADETILVISWQEVIKNCVHTFAEVKVADASQFRRYLCGDTYGSSVQQMASEMAETVNAVVAINGDFYAFRTMGINVYQRQLYRFKADALDTCFVDSKGDLLLVKSGELATREDAEEYIAEHDVLFGLAFGPILVEDGVAITSVTYPIGEVNKGYARSSIGQVDDLHYLLMVSGKAGIYPNSTDVVTMAGVMADKGCDRAYTLDGGQTAVIVMQGKPRNRVVYDMERNMSDILYFATALPD